MRFETTRAQILSAMSAREIERILFDAVSQIDPGELRPFPPECLGVLANRELDIHEAAVTLLHSDLMHRGEQGVGELLRQIAELYASASARLSLIQRRFSGAAE